MSAEEFWESGQSPVLLPLMHPTDKAKIFAFAEAYAHSLTTHSERWISVEEKLPENQQAVLFYVRTDQEGKEWRVLGGKFTPHGFSVPGVCYGSEPDWVSHWKPAPIPPTHSEEEK